MAQLWSLGHEAVLDLSKFGLVGEQTREFALGDWFDLRLELTRELRYFGVAEMRGFGRAFGFMRFDSDFTLSWPNKAPEPTRSAPVVYD